MFGTRLSSRRLALVLATLSSLLLIAALGPGYSSTAVAATPTVDLGQASTYAVLSGASVGNTVNAVGAPHTTLHGDLGVKANTQPTGFPPGIVTGEIRVGSTVDQAFADLVTAYGEVAGRPGGTAMAGDLAGRTLSPGLHSAAAAVSNTGTVTLDGGGDPEAVFVVKVGGALTMAAGARVTLTNGATAARVHWQVNGAVDIGANARFAGTVMALDAIAIGAGTEVNGRLLARTGAIALDANEVYSGPPVVTVTGGATAITTDTTPTIEGTTDGAPATVTVTVAGQTLTATPSGGTWSVTSGLLANGTYPVVATTRDGAGNVGSATQQLTVDTVLPVVTIDGGPSATTNDPTPTIAGTSDAAPGTMVRVTVDAQTLTALVQAGGGWNVTPSALSDGTRTITASVTDPAGNDGTASQLLTVDVAPPAVTITGGPEALTNDPTPEISGTADVASGTTVTVTVAVQTLTAAVGANGVWAVNATALPDGPHRIVMSVSDGAGNAASADQTLTVDTVAPAVAIDGGAAATTDDASPTVAGTSDAAPGTTITVSIAGQTRTTLLQPDRTWNVTTTLLGAGTWPLVVTAPDPAGNVGSASQSLTVDPAAPTAGPTGPAGPAGPSGPAGGTGEAGPVGGSGPSGAVGGTGPAGADGAPGTSGARGATGTTGATGATGAPGGTAAGSRLTVLLAASSRARRGRRVQLRFAVNGPATVTVTLMRGTRAVARLSATRRSAGRGTVAWSGMIGRRPAARGLYRIAVRAVSPAGASAGDASTLRLV